MFPRYRHEGLFAFAWHVEPESPDCPPESPFAVVDDDTDEVVNNGCYETEDEANGRVAALYADEAGIPVDAAEAGADPVLAAVYSAWDKKFAVTVPDAPPAVAPAPVAASSFDPSQYSLGYWRGIIAVEEVETGDSPRREFAADSLSFRDPPLSIYWQKVTAEGHDNAFIVAKAAEIWRASDIELKDGRVVSGLRARGMFNLVQPEGAEAHQLVGEEFLRGVSVTCSETQESDVEYIWPEGTDSEDMLAMPEKVVYHVAEMIDACLTGQPALKQCYVELVADADWASQPAEWLPPGSTVEPVAVQSGEPAEEDDDEFRAVAAHDTPTTAGAWHASANAARLQEHAEPSLEVARSAFAWVDASSDVPSGKFLHHAVNARGRVGAANLAACRLGIAALNGSKGALTIPVADREGVYRHLAAHLRSAGQEPPALVAAEASEVMAALTAGLAPPMRPPRAWLTDPKLAVPTHARYLDSGECFGHLAVWGVCHLSFAPRVCVTPPRGGDYTGFTHGTLVCDDGSEVAVGVLTLGPSHAPATLGFAPSVRHYEDTGLAVADIAVGEDRHGIWFHGALRPDVTERQLRVLRAAGVSGDWRRTTRGQWRLAGGLVVNVPGFEVPRTRVATHNGEQTALVAAGMLLSQPENVIPIGVADRIARSVGLDHPSRMRALRERVLGKE